MKEVLELSCYIQPEMVLDLDVSTKNELLDTMIKVLVHSDKISDPEKVRSAILTREKAGNTGIGKGFAIPHARMDCVPDFVVAFARISKGLDYSSEDGEPVKLAFMIVASDQQDKQYIKLLSRLMLRLKNPEFVKKLLDAADTTELYNLIKNTK